METAAIVTTQASRDIAHIHDRMPVILPPDAFDLWLDCRNVDAMTATSLIMPSRPGLLEAYEVSSAVNAAANDSPELLLPAPPASEQPPQPAPASVRRTRAPKKDDRQSSLF
jgi:putative SOS response-associated peptidase YedK